jgi:26S proteasome regulatory subunit N7
LVPGSISFSPWSALVCSSAIQKSWRRISPKLKSIFVFFSIEFYLQSFFRLIDEGGDWDRRNRLKVYNGLYLVSIRQFKRGGELLLDALSTFTATELISYNDFVALTVIVNSLTLTRVDLKKRVSFSSHDSHIRLLTATQSWSTHRRLFKPYLNCLSWVTWLRTYTIVDTTNFLLPSVILTSCFNFWTR